MRILSAIVLLALCAGCPKPPPRLPDSLPEAQLPPTNPEWTRDLPATLREVRLHAAQDCVFVTGVDTAAGSDRTQICVDSLSGEPKWAHSDPVHSAVHAVDTYFILDTCLLHAWREGLVCVYSKYINVLNRSIRI